VAGENFVSISGNLTRDPNLQFTAGGQSYVQLGLAHNARYFKDGAWVDRQVSFFDVTVWGDLAVNCAESLRRGLRVRVVGRLEYRTWEKDGESFSKVSIVADDVAPSLHFATALVAKAGRATVEAASNGAAPTSGK